MILKNCATKPKPCIYFDQITKLTSIENYNIYSGVTKSHPRLANTNSQLELNTDKKANLQYFS